MAEQLPQQATGANIRSAINTNAEQLETVTEAVGHIIGVPSDFFLNGKINPAYLPSIPENLLPEVDIFPLFNPDQFEVVDGQIDIIGGVRPTTYTVSLNITGLPAETPVTVDGDEWVDYQKSFAAGTVIDSIAPVADGYTFSPTSAGPVTVDGDKTLNFTATPVDPGGLVSVTDVTLITGAVQDGNDYSWPGGGGVGYVISTKKIPAGQPFRVVFDGDPNAKSATLAVTPNNAQEGENSFLSGIKWEPKGVNEGLFAQVANGSGETDYTGRPYTGTAKGMIIGDGENIQIMRNMNGDGVTYVELFPGTVIVQPNADLYIKMLFFEANTTVLNLNAEGLV